MSTFYSNRLSPGLYVSQRQNWITAQRRYDVCDGSYFLHAYCEMNGCVVVHLKNLGDSGDLDGMASARGRIVFLCWYSGMLRTSPFTIIVIVLLSDAGRARVGRINRKSGTIVQIYLSCSREQTAVA